ncbi:MAG: tetratricopeptide repeat protein [Pseudomonadales bacterium]|nr:tetratricopeptide repeat protein [Pseudomonadales bacterium]MDG1444087.1 tetratricopeptide repeat protein [Pseudomonadales bacterium]
MQQIENQQGLAFSADQISSVERFDDLIEAYLGSKADVMSKLTLILEQDQDMPMAHCFKAYLMKLGSDPRLLPGMDNAIEQLELMRPILNDREARHLTALTSWSDNQLKDTIRVLEELLTIYPHDVLALRINHHLHFYSGDAFAMRDSVATVLPHWQQGDKFFNFIVGMQAFGLEESGDYKQAEKSGRQAVEANPNDLWAAHAVAHVMQMQERFNDGIRWLTPLLQSWSNTNNFIYHLHWHQALFYLGINLPEQALEIYDEFLETPIKDDFYLDVCNSTALLWRLERLGIDVGHRWESLSALSSQRIKDTELVFCSLHYLLTPIRLNQPSIINEAISSMSQWATIDSTQGRLAADVGLPIAHAMLELARKNYSSSANKMDSVAQRLHEIGGSHAQRHLFIQMREFAQQHANA